MKWLKRRDWFSILLIAAIVFALIPWIDTHYKIFTEKLIDQDEAWAEAKADFKEDESRLEKKEFTNSQLVLAEYVLTRVYYKSHVMKEIAAEITTAVFLSTLIPLIILPLLLAFLLRKVRKLEKKVTELESTRSQVSAPAPNA